MEVFDYSLYGDGDGAAAGDVGGFFVTNDDDGNPIGSSGSYTVYPVQVPNNNGGSYGDAFKVLESVTTGLQGIAKTYLGFQKDVASFKTQQSGITLARDQSLAANEIAKLNNASALELAGIKTKGAVDIAKYQAATQSVLAQRQLQSSAMPSLGAMFYPATMNANGTASINPLFIALAAGGFFLAYRSMKR